MGAFTTLTTRGFFRLCRAGVSEVVLIAFLVGLSPRVASAAQKTKPPAQAEAAYAGGMQALQRGDLSAAEAAFKKVLRLVPASAEGHNSLGWVFMAQEKSDPAIREFRAAIKLKPEFPQARINLANAFLHTGDRDGALRESKEVVRLNTADYA